MDQQLENLLKSEIRRQQDTIDLIPSENIADPEMLKILGSPLVNKYSEGYPDRRYYPGNKYYDAIEKLAQQRALEAFGLDAKKWHVNVQPYSGSPANQAIYFALVKPGDTVMGLSLVHGGHLTHGHFVNFSGIIYKSRPYSLDLRTGLIDYSNLEKLAKKFRPKIIFSGATAYPRKIDFKKIGVIAQKIGAYHVADISHIAGLIAAGLHPKPFPYADVVMTTTHKTLRGPRGAVIFSKKLPTQHDPDLLISDAIDKAVFPGLQGGPHNNVTAAIAWTFQQAGTAKFKKYQKQVVGNAVVLAETLKKYHFDLLSGGTDNHLILINLKNKNLTGSEAEKLLEAAGILANRNAIPGDVAPFKPSGLRLGTPAVTSRGFKEKEMRQIGEFIHQLINLKIPASTIRKNTLALCRRFPLSYK